MTGRVEVWTDRGFGFVRASTGERVFLHRRDVVEDLESKDAEPGAGDVVEYEEIVTGRGPRAVGARIVKRAEEAKR